jgi:hypothetical protein
VPKTATWHNAGWLDFGPNDGYLYVTVGDPNGSNAQVITNNLQGKVLRLDVTRDDFPDDPAHNYAIPPNNPFVGKDGDDEIWAFGLRNPWRASFDRETGDLWINDVGEFNREEVNFQPAGSTGGENYAWPRREGTSPYFGGELMPGDSEPVYDYPHNGPDPLFTGFTIAAGGVYRGSVAALRGHYLFTDHGSTNIWKLDPDAVDIPASVTNINAQLDATIDGLRRIVSFGEDANGELYLVNFDGGGIARVATHSADAVWNGDDSLWGAAGDGASWGSGANWTRAASADVSFVPQDNVIFAPSSQKPHVFLGRDRTVAAVTFQASYTLHDHTLQVLSGNVTVEAGVTATIASAISAETANHSIRKLGDGMLVVEGNAGQTVVKQGTLGGTGSLDHLSVRSGGTVAPGVSAGVLNVSNSFRMEPGAKLAIELGGRSNTDLDNPQFDQLLIGGVAMLAGILDVARVDLGSGIFAPRDSDVFPILSAVGGITGSFESLELPPLPTGLAWRLNSDGFTMSLAVIAQLPGDYNTDGSVDLADYAVWRNTSGQNGANLAADGTGPGGSPDGIVNLLDYQYWRRHFGTTASATAALATVPAPRSIRLSLLSLCILLLHGRRAFKRLLSWQSCQRVVSSDDADL